MLPLRFCAALIVTILALPNAWLFAQHHDVAHRHAGLQAADYDAVTRVMPAQTAGKAASPSAVFEVEYHGFSQQAQNAFEHALSIWATHISSPVPIRVRAEWRSLESNTLGSAGAPSIVSFQGAPAPNTLYAPSLAGALSGQTIAVVDHDIVASFNSDRSDWYYGIDGVTPIGQFDFVTVVLHEIGHGLGMFTSFRIEGEEASGAGACAGASDGDGCWGYELGFPPSRYASALDHAVFDVSGLSLISGVDYPSPSATLSAALTGSQLYFDGPFVRSTNGDLPARAFAPGTFQPGSSLSHFDESTYPAGDANSLMTPALARAEAIHSPGPVFCGLLAEIGWPLGDGCVYLIENPDVGIGDGAGGDDGEGGDDSGDNGDDGDDGVEDGEDGDGGNDSGNDGEDGETTVSIEVVDQDVRGLSANGPFPNPASTKTSLTLGSAHAQTVSVALFDLMGREHTRLAIRMGARENVSVDLPLTSLPAGVYLIRIVGDSDVVSRSVVVAR